MTDTNDINKLLKEAGLTPEQMAVMCGVNHRTVHNWCAGRSRPRTSDLLLLSIIARNGLRIVTTDPLAFDFLVTMIEALVRDGHGIVAVHRRLGCGYGDANRLIEQVKKKINC